MSEAAMSDAARRQSRSETRRGDRTLLEQALAVCMTGGYLYRYECMKVACLSHGCHDLYQECKDNFPACTEVFIHVLERPYFWVSDQTKALVTSHAFLHTVFDKINRLRVQSQATPKKCAEAKAALPLWGVDAQVAILGFSRGRGRSPAVVVRFTRSQFPPGPVVSEHSVWRCMLHSSDFTLLPSRFHQDPAIRDYDGEPLWP
jgi:hypothetical protein